MIQPGAKSPTARRLAAERSEQCVPVPENQAKYAKHYAAPATPAASAPAAPAASTPAAPVPAASAASAASAELVVPVTYAFDKIKTVMKEARDEEIAAVKAAVSSSVELIYSTAHGIPTVASHSSSSNASSFNGLRMPFPHDFQAKRIRKADWPLQREAVFVVAMHVHLPKSSNVFDLFPDLNEATLQS